MPGPSIAIAPRPYLRTPEDAQGFWQLGNLWRVTATGHQTGGSLSFIDQLVTDDGGGPGIHMHNSDEGLYVVSGHCDFHAGGESLSAGPGSLVLVPRFTEHAFRVDAPGTQLLNFYVPAGIELYLIAFAHPAVRNELPKKGEVPMPPPRLVEQISRDYGQFAGAGFPLPVLAPPTPDQFVTRRNPDAIVQPFLATAASSARWWYDGQLWSVLADQTGTDGSLSMFEILAPRGAGAKPHLFAASDQFLYVLEGEIDMLLGCGTKVAGKGDFVFVPQGTPHARRVRSASARILQLVTPSGFERLLRIAGEKTEAMSLTSTGSAEKAIDEDRRQRLLDEIGLRPIATADPFA